MQSSRHSLNTLTVNGFTVPHASTLHYDSHITLMCDSLKLHINYVTQSCQRVYTWTGQLLIQRHCSQGTDDNMIPSWTRSHPVTLSCKARHFYKITKMLYCSPDSLSMTPPFYCCFYFWIVRVNFVQILPVYFVFLYTVCFKILLAGYLTFLLSVFTAWLSTLQCLTFLDGETR